MTTIRWRVVTPLALALGLLVVTQIAGATHVRPKGATPLRVSLVPAYEPCTSPNRTHGPPLAFPSCSPPMQSSNFLTVGTPDANGAAANSIGSLRLDVKATSPEDLLVRLTVTDVRCRPGTDAGVCSGANAADGPDYSGELQSNATDPDHRPLQRPEPGRGRHRAGHPVPRERSLSNTADTSTGGVCSVTTSSMYDCPPCVRDRGRTAYGRRDRPGRGQRRWRRTALSPPPTTRSSCGRGSLFLEHATVGFIHETDDHQSDGCRWHSRSARWA